MGRRPIAHETRRHGNSHGAVLKSFDPHRPEPALKRCFPNLGAKPARDGFPLGLKLFAGAPACVPLHTVPRVFVIVPTPVCRTHCRQLTPWSPVRHQGRYLFFPALDAPQNAAPARCFTKAIRYQGQKIEIEYPHFSGPGILKDDVHFLDLFGAHCQGFFQVTEDREPRNDENETNNAAKLMRPRVARQIPRCVIGAPSMSSFQISSGSLTAPLWLKYPSS